MRCTGRIARRGVCWLCFGLSAFFLIQPAAAAVERTFYVSPNGDDRSDGTEAKPFATLERARQAVREANRAAAGDIEVVLRGGVYRLERSLVFEAADSGKNGHRIAYKSRVGETPVISGGRRITGWQPDRDGRWKAAAPPHDFRQFYVNGRRAVRARGALPQGLALSGEDGYRTGLLAMAGWKNPSDIEFCYQVVWCHTRCKVQAIRGEKSEVVITMQQPAFRLARNKEGVQIDMPSYVENALELLDEPGEWYLDRPTRTLYYRPRPGEDMAKAEAIAPSIDRLVEFRGTLEHPVENIHFVGLTLAEAGWLEPNQVGHVDVQANFRLFEPQLLKRDGKLTTVHNEHVKSPSGVVGRAVRGVRFEQCIFTRLGGGGLDLEFGAQGNQVIGCRFYDISGSAIQLGDVLKSDHHPDDPRAIVKNNTIANNAIHDVCVEYKGGVGIFVGYTEGSVIVHNEIRDLPYSGISLGWGWGEEDAGGGAANYFQPFRYATPTPAKNNRIEHNHIHHVMQELQDGGGIYTLGNQPGTIIRANHLHDNRGVPGGIYLDEGSGFIEVAGNLVYNVPRAMNFNNRAQDRIATCKEHDNCFDQSPASSPLAAKIAAEAAAGATAMPNPFYAYCVGIGTDHESATLKAQLELPPMLAELGYSGMAHVGLAGAMELLGALEKHHQKLFAVYTDLVVDPGDRGYDPQLKELIPKLKGHDTLVWLVVNSRKYKPSSTEGDERAVELLREISDLAKVHGVAISLYPHKGCYAERMEDVVRLAKKTGRPNVGVTFTFCHFLAVDELEHLERVLEMARPYLTMVTINGTSGFASGNLASWIQVLGEGTLDVGVVLKALRKLDYRGPIGIIAYGIKGDRREILSRSIQAWKRLP